MTPIDDLLRDTMTVPAEDSTERRALTQARAALDAAFEPGSLASSRSSSPRRRLPIRSGLRLAPALISAAVTLVIAVGAVVLVRHRGSDQSGGAPASGATRPGAAVHGDSALVAQLAVLRRPQTASDRLPARVLSHWSQIAADNGLTGAHLVRRDSRMVSQHGSVTLYLIVVTPTGGLFPVADGDDAAVLAITPSGLTVDPQPVPAAAFRGDTFIDLVGEWNGSGRQPWPSAEFRRYAAWVSIVPDSVARVVWSGRSRNSMPVRLTPPIVNNVVAAPITSIQSPIHVAWYDATGQRIDTVDVQAQAEAKHQLREYLQALGAAGRSTVTAPARLLSAFSVFSFHSPTGTRIADGYVISAPLLSRLPLGVLAGAASRTTDFREVRKVSAPSGLSMYILPGPDGLCVLATFPNRRRASPEQTTSDGGSCSARLSSALASGAGFISGGGDSSMTYDVQPIAHPTTTVGSGRHKRTITPLDGVAIIETPGQPG